MFLILTDLARLNGTKHEHLNLFEEDQSFGLALMEKQFKASIDMHDQRLLRSGSRAQGTRYFTHPLGNKLTKKEVKRIAKKEKELAAMKMIRKDTIEDVRQNRMNGPNHYEIQEHNYKIDYQKELLCAGHSIRVILKFSIFFNFTWFCLVMWALD